MIGQREYARRIKFILDFPDTVMTSESTQRPNSDGLKLKVNCKIHKSYLEDKSTTDSNKYKRNHLSCYQDQENSNKAENAFKESYDTKKARNVPKIKAWS